MIEIKNVNFFYQGNEQENAVENLNLSIPKGQVLVLCGESGCGENNYNATDEWIDSKFL